MEERMHVLGRSVAHLMLVLVVIYSTLGCGVDFDDDDLTIATDTLPEGVVGRSYSFEIDTEGDADVFRIVSGDLPPGILLSSDGELSGTPQLVGTFNFTIEVLDLFDTFVEDSASKGFSLLVRP